MCAHESFGRFSAVFALFFVRLFRQYYHIAFKSRTRPAQRQRKIAPKNSCPHTLVETVCLYGILLTLGVSTTIFGTVLTLLIGEFGLALKDGGVFTVMQNIGCFGGVLLSGAVLDRFSKRGVIVAVFSLYILALFAIPQTKELAPLLAVIFLSGVSMKLLDASLNTAVSEMHPENKGFFLSLLHCSYGVGSFTGPVLAGALLGPERGWRLSFTVLGCVCLILLVAYAVIIRNAPQPQHAVAAVARKVPLLSLVNRDMLVLCLVIVFYCGHQIGINTWLPAYMNEVVGVEVSAAGFGVSIFWLGLILSRLACSFLTRKYDEKLLLLLGCSLAALCLLSGIAVGSEVSVRLGVAGAGLFSGAAIPLVLTLGYSANSHAQGKVSMLLFIAITIGGVVFPWIMGMVGGAYGLTAAMWLDGLLLVLAALAAACAGSEKTPSRPTASAS